MTAPSIKFEVAFNAGFATPVASRTWTDVSTYVVGASGAGIRVGRTGELSIADPNTLSLTLDNADGRFTPGGSGPYAPNVKIGRPIRVTASGTGWTSVRFEGFIDDWALSWEPSGRYSEVGVTATSRLARLGIGYELGDLPTDAAKTRGATSFFRFNEKRDDGKWPNAIYPTATLSDVSGTVEVATSDLFTGAQLRTGAYVISGDLPPVSDPFTFSTCFTTETADTSFYMVLRERIPLGISAGQNVQVDVFGTVGATISPLGSSAATGTASVIVGECRHVAVVASGTSASFYVDGALVNTVALATPMTERMGNFEVSLNQGSVLLGSLAVIPSALTASEVALLSATTRAAYTADSARNRLDTYLDQFPTIESAVVSLPTASGTVTPIDTEGRNVLELWRDIEQADGGVVWDSPDGITTYSPPAVRYNASPTITLDASTHEVDVDYAPTLDRSTLQNMATVTAASTSREFTVSDAASVEEYGPYGSSETLPLREADAEMVAGFRVARYAEPKLRATSATVDVTTWSTSAQNAFFTALKVGARARITNLPSQSPSTTIDYFIEGWSEQLAPGTHSVSLNLSPATLPGYAVWVIGDATFGDPTAYAPAR